VRCTDCETEPLNLALLRGAAAANLLHETQAEEASLFGGEGRRVVASGAWTTGLPTQPNV
jgi:hypothetical protein